MKFQETDPIKFRTYPKLGKSLIYFLVYKKEVVYIGKTNHGLGRVFSHRHKQHDSLYIIPCDSYLLKATEAEFIIKYKPKYNIIDGNLFLIKDVRDYLREMVDSDYSVVEARRILQIVGIPVRYYKTKEYMSVKDFPTLEKWVVNNE